MCKRDIFVYFSVLVFIAGSVVFFKGKRLVLKRNNNIEKHNQVEVEAVKHIIGHGHIAKFVRTLNQSIIHRYGSELSDSCEIVVTRDNAVLSRLKLKQKEMIPQIYSLTVHMDTIFLRLGWGSIRNQIRLESLQKLDSLFNIDRLSFDLASGKLPTHYLCIGNIRTGELYFERIGIRGVQNKVKSCPMISLLEYAERCEYKEIFPDSIYRSNDKIAKTLLVRAYVNEVKRIFWPPIMKNEKGSWYPKQRVPSISTENYSQFMYNYFENIYLDMKQSFGGISDESVILNPPKYDTITLNLIDCQDFGKSIFPAFPTTLGVSGKYRGYLDALEDAKLQKE